jgi:hypothetical protein
VLSNRKCLTYLGCFDYTMRDMESWAVCYCHFKKCQCKCTFTVIMIDTFKKNCQINLSLTLTNILTIQWSHLHRLNFKCPLYLSTDRTYNLFQNHKTLHFTSKIQPTTSTTFVFSVFASVRKKWGYERKLLTVV